MIAGKPSRILVVDDEDRNRRLMEALISPLGHEVILASDGEEGLAKAVSESPDLILLDVMMPKLNGFEVAQRLKEDWQTKTIPIVIVTALREVEDRVRALEAGADDFLSKPVDKIELRARITSLLKVKAYHEYMRNYQKMLEEEVEHKTRELKSAFEKIKGASLETILRLCRAAEFKDEETGNHLRRVSRYVAIIARDLGLSANYQEQLIYSAPMHDIGKIGIPEKILLKKGKLDPGEWEIMKQHTTIGARILSGSNEEFIKLGELIALTHHERWDGSGYPRGLGRRDPHLRTDHGHRRFLRGHDEPALLFAGDAAGRRPRGHPARGGRPVQPADRRHLSGRPGRDHLGAHEFRRHGRKLPVTGDEGLGNLRPGEPS